MLKKMLPLLVFGAIALTGAIVAVAGDAPKAKDVMVFESAKKMVTFNHAEHSEYAEGKCVTCHHKDEVGKETGCSAEGCHPEKTSGPDDKSVTRKNAFHKQCKNCHKEQDKGPYKKCSDCHVKKEAE